MKNRALVLVGGAVVLGGAFALLRRGTQGHAQTYNGSGTPKFTIGTKVMVAGHSGVYYIVAAASAGAGIEPTYTATPAANYNATFGSWSLGYPGTLFGVAEHNIKAAAAAMAAMMGRAAYAEGAPIVNF